jgi:ferrous iron transport protein A
MKARHRTPHATPEPEPSLTLADLRTGERCIIDRLDLPDEVARRLMELGFLPGNEVVPARRAPGGGPRIFRVDGSEVALRHETAERLYVRRGSHFVRS